MPALDVRAWYLASQLSGCAHVIRCTIHVTDIAMSVQLFAT
jgi:hypothetical protein